jgi:hypothetical protein
MGFRINCVENLYLENQNSSQSPQEGILTNQEPAIVGSRLGLRIACLQRILFDHLNLLHLSKSNLNFCQFQADQKSLSEHFFDFGDSCLLIRHGRLLCGFCSSGQRFACGFLQVSPRDGHPCRPANTSPVGRVEDFRLQVGAPCRAHQKKRPDPSWTGSFCFRVEQRI